MISEPPHETDDQIMCRQELNHQNKDKVIEGKMAKRAFCQNVSGTLIPWSIFNDSNSVVTERKNNHITPRGYSKSFKVRPVLLVSHKNMWCLLATYFLLIGCCFDSFLECQIQMVLDFD